MTEAEFLSLLFVRAAEECDPDGRVLSLAARERAGRDAGEPPGEDSREAQEAWLAARALRLSETLDRDHPELARARAALGHTLPALPFAAVAFAAGFLADALGSVREVNLLALPLLGILAWNFVVLLAGPIVRAGGGNPGGWIVALLRRAWLVRGERVGRRLGTERETRAYLGRVLARAAELVEERAGALGAARVRARLHLAGAAFAAGTVASLYAAGFAFEYRVTWESTFLDAGGAARLLGTLLAPASALLSLPVPTADALAALQAPASGDAAHWIHRWALTLVLFVIVPRLALASFAGLRARRLAHHLAPDRESAWALRLLAAGRGGGERVDILPYSAAPTPLAADRLRDLCLELFGRRASIVLSEGLSYGEEAPPGEADGHAIVVFDLAQTPESEVHGRFLQGCQTRTQARPDRRLLVLLEESRYRAKAGEERGDERRRSWDRFLRDLGLTAATLPEAGAPGEGLAAARAALWPEAP